ncbi:MAG: hypothetical protein ACE145_05930 [Terriglobia bacterium]
MLAFLCGGMEYATDGGRAWRERIRLWLQEAVNHRVYDPTIEAQRIFSAEELAGFTEWKTSDVERFRRVMRVAISRDLDVMANQADYVVCLWDEAAMRGGGTHAELTAATRKGIPVYMVTEIPSSEISGWILACVDRVFGNFEELKAFLLSTYGRESRQQALWK